MTRSSAPRERSKIIDIVRSEGFFVFDLLSTEKFLARIGYKQRSAHRLICSMPSFIHQAAVARLVCFRCSFSKSMLR